MIQSFRISMQRLAGDISGPIIVACSGGSDSMALAELSAESAKIDNQKLILVHFDHGLRANTGEREHLEKWAGTRGVEIISRNLLLPESLEENPGNLEARARKLRYEALEEIADETGAKVVLTGHNADDQAETLWLWLLRGTGLRGLRGIAPARPLREGCDIQLVRPLLDCTRVQLRDYLTARGTSWIEDPSNADTGLRRNRIRHKLLPFLRENFEADPVTGAARLGRQARELSDFLDWEVRERGLEVENLGEHLRLDRETLNAAPAALAHWTLSSALSRQAVSSDLSVTRILELSGGSATGKVLELGEGLVAIFTSQHLFIGPAGLPLPQSEEIPLHHFDPGGVALPDSGDLRIGDWILRIREGSLGIEMPKGPESAYFDRDSLVKPLRLDNPQPGMRIRPMGASGGKSLSDLLIDRKVPGRWRKDLVVLMDATGKLLWVPGVSRGEDAPVETKTKFCLSLDLERASS